MPELSELEQSLTRAIRLTGTGSYQRERPSGQSIPALTEVKVQLLEFLEAEPDSSRAWIMLSRVQEALLDYSAAARSIERGIQCGDTSKKNRKRLAMMRKGATEQRQFPLDREQSGALKNYLELHNANEEAFGRGLEVSRDWLDANDFSDPDAVLRAFESHGCFDDFSIYRRLVEQDR